MNFTTIHGCDSVVTLNLTVNPIYTTPITASICEGGVYTENGFNTNIAGLSTLNFATIHGCDSIVTLNLTILPLPEVPTYQPVSNVGEYTLPSVENGVWTNETGDIVTLAETDGVYTLTVTGEGDCENSTTLTVEITTGIEEILAEKLMIYPNPAKKELFIKSELPVKKIELLDLTGRTVETWHAASLQNSATTINLSALPQGVYMLKIYTDSGVAVKKVVKE